MSQVQVEASINKVHHARVDRISYLPENVTQQILECLPLQDAVRTSILSEHWRYKWVIISQVVLDEQFFSTILVGRIETPDISQTYLNIVNNVLLCLPGPLRKFVLYIPDCFTDTKSISHWIRFTSGKGVKVITLMDSRKLAEKIPSSLFFSAGLTQLSLVCCKIPSIPPTFTGFPCLISLKVLFCDITSVGPNDNVLEILVNSCRQLLYLYLSTSTFLSLTIHAPKLLSLNIGGLLSNLRLGIGTTKIKTLRIGVFCKSWTESSRCLSCLTTVESLFLDALFWMSCNIRRVNNPILEAFGDKLGRLRTLELHGIPLNCDFASFIVLELFKRSTLLRQLYVKASEKCDTIDCKGRFLMGMAPCFNLPILKTAKIVGITGSSSELQFIKFVLAGAPVLEVLTIELSVEVSDSEEKLQIAKHLMQYCRASTIVEILFKT